MLKDKLGLGRSAHAVKGFEVGACDGDGVTVGQDKCPLQQASLLHACDGVRQLDVVHVGKLMSREQADAIEAATEPDGGPEQTLHAAVVGQLGDEVPVVLVRAIVATGILFDVLLSIKVGPVLPDEQPDLLLAGVMAGMQVEGHDPDGIVVALSQYGTGQQPYRNQEYVAKSHDEKRYSSVAQRYFFRP